MRLLVVIGFLIAATGAIAAIFWNQELKYQLPTPKPVDYKEVLIGTNIDETLLPKANAYFLHFYNPDCPCSRFNARHLKSLMRSYHDSVSMYIVVAHEQDLAKASQEFGEQQYVVDRDGKIAAACGVYSTPQAAIVDFNGNLYYRGNYNKSRYCTDRASNFAELSLLALLNRQPPPMFGLLATQSYGCEWKQGNDNLVLF